MGASKLVPTPKNGDWSAVRRAISMLASSKLGPEATPTFGGLTINGDLSLTGDLTVGGSMSLSGTLNMNDNPIIDVGYMDFNLVNGIAQAEGRLVWNDDDGTLNLGMPGGEVNLQIGQETLIRARNNTGSTMPNGTVVRVSGSFGNFALIELADANDVNTGVTGFTTESIDDNSFGYVTIEGMVRDVNTNAYAAGTFLFLSETAGEFTNAPPTGNTRNNYVGQVIVQGVSNGIILAHPVSSPFLGGLSGVVITSVADNNVLQYSGANSQWENEANLDITGTITASGLITASTLTASRLVASDGAKGLVSSDLYAWVAGTSNRVTVADDSDGTITLSGPQDIHVGARPTFLGVNCTDETDVLQVDSVSILNMTGSQNMAFGIGGGSTGAVSKQSVFGYEAGVSATGNDQAALGYRAGYQNSGFRCTQMGQNAGRGNSGDYQAAMGFQAGRDNTGVNQCCFGLNSGHTNTGVNQTAFGTSAGQVNVGAHQVAFGYLTGLYNIGISQNAIGNSAGYQNSGTYQVALGHLAGGYNDGDTNTALGAYTFNAFNLDAGSAKTFDYTDVDQPNNQMTVTAHSFGATNAYRNLYFQQGTSALTGVLNNTKHLFKIIDANTLEFVSDTITAAGTGTGHTLTPQYVYDNSTALGNNSEPTASNQIMLGDTNITEVVTYGTLVLPKTTGMGIKVDPAAPTFGWRDLLGPVTYRGVGATDPTLAVYRGGIKQYRFAVNDEGWFEFHIPHDYVAGSDIFVHHHWSHISAVVTGGSVTWGYEVTYAKGHNQAAFSAPVTPTVVSNASTTQYQHILTDLQLSATSPSGTQIDSDDLEPDGVILLRAYLNANNITSSGAVPDPFIHYVDIHYQSTNMATKDRAPDFYA